MADGQIGAGPVSERDRETLAETAEVLRGMMIRLRAILDNPPLTEDRFVEIASIYDNVAYTFLYLESNEVFVSHDGLLPWRDAFYNNTELDAQVLGSLLQLRCAHPDAEDSRQRYVEYLRDKLNGHGSSAGEDDARLQSAAKTILHEVEADQRELLRRVGANPGQVRPPAAFYKLVSGTSSAERRERLTQAWTQARDRHLDALVDVIDGVIDRRRRESSQQGYASVLSRTLERCQVSEGRADAYIEKCLRGALKSQAELDDEIRNVVGPTRRPLDHFGHYVHTLQAGRRIPLLRLDDCLSFIFLVAAKTFGLSISRAAGVGGNTVTTTVALDDSLVGQIIFDLWDVGRTSRAANYTRGIRNRTDWAGLVQTPIAYVSCRFNSDHRGASRITFQNAHSLFHEFGHAVNHLLIRKRLPNQSGLEYLPLERLENLSMWFEKWVYHPEFGESLRLNAEDSEGLALCQYVKALEYRRTHVERAVTAALDFDVHRRGQGGLRESFERMNERFRISPCCTLGDFPAYFTWPMFQANPGANFAYLWGASDSAQRFIPFMHRRLDDVASSTEVRAMFSSCFDGDEASCEPESDTTIDFYRRVPLPPSE